MVVLSGITCVQTFAQEAQVFEFAPYTVSATRLESDWMQVAQAVSVVGQDQIQRANQQITLDESLQGMPGVFILNPYNYAQDTRISIRGFGARADFGIRGIRLVIDGIPATTPDGQGEVDGMDLGSTTRIEVLRGPSAAYYGAASGGVIVMETESGTNEPFIEGRLTVGDDDLLSRQFKAGGTEGNLDYLISGAYLTSDGYRAHSETENTRINGKLRYHLANGHLLQFVFNVIDFPLQNDPGGLTLSAARADPRQARDRNILFDSGESVRQERFGLTYDMDLDEDRSLEFRLFHTHRDFANRLPFESGGQVSYDRKFYGSRIAFKQTGDRSRFSTGIDVDIQDDARKNHDNLNGTRGQLALDQDEYVQSIGLFLIYEYQLSNAIRFSSALRYDDIEFDVDDALLTDGDDSGEISFSELSPSVGLTWSVSDEVSLYANVSRSYETPTTTEFDNPEGGGFNTDLDSQQAMNYEVGYRGRTTAGSIPVEFNLALFHIDIEDALVPFELEQFPDREFYRNAGDSTRRGLEAQVSAYLGSGFTLKVDYTWSDFSYDSFVTDNSDFSGNRIPGIPRHFGSLILNYESDSGFYATWQTRFIGSFYANDSNAEEVSSYTVSDFRIGYAWDSGNWSIQPFLGINNILDESYFANIRINAFGGRHHESAPERNVYGGVSIRYSY